ncbi:extracellular solute-binding protein [Gracilibacillus timonensis]|uniref:extracellular solute-binding protein n=1 Tax=Gracilibacillus timonensis TaxID=1816696 RepID=UPI000826E02A|nr:extracellular solute-binding protein [Gracilibacillus timonensis]
MKKFLFVLLFVILLSACDETNSGTSSEKDTDSTEISIMTQFYSATPPSDDNALEQAIEEKTNTKLNIQWNSSNNYQDKFNVAMVSEELTDLVLIPNEDPFTNPVFMDAAEQGAFWDVSSYIDDYPNLKNKIPEVAWELSSLNGANYFVPRPRPSEGSYFFTLRKDWLKNVGLEMPTTDEELYEVLKAFSEQDPDQNGKDDTTGFTGAIWDDSMGDFENFEFMFTGVIGEWKEENGELIYSAFLPGMREGIEYMKKAYEEGLIAEDFASLTNTQKEDMFSGGDAGVMIQTASSAKYFYDIISENDSNYELTDFQPVMNINGYNPKGTGYNGGNAIPKTVPEEKMKEILGMLDTWMEDDIFKLHHTGIEGVHHTLNGDGELEIDQEKVEEDGLGNFSQIVFVADPYGNGYKSDFPEDAKEVYKEIIDEKSKTGVGPVAAGLVTESSEKYLPEIRKNMTDIKIKIILGHEPITAWDDFVEQLKKDQGMQQVTQEINDLYQSRK